MPVAGPFSLDGRLAVVTGGSRGIGYAIAAGLIGAGARAAITARHAQPLAEAAERLGPNALAFPCDNADAEDIARTVEKIWSLAPIDVLVNNAGISPFYKRAEHVTVEEFDLVNRVNFRGTYLWSVEVARRLFAADRPGSIINITSTLGIVPGERLGAYSAIKAGLNQLTRACALEWADRRVRVNAIAPGWTETDFTGGLFGSRHGEKLLADVPMGRWGQPADVAGAAVFLASEASAYATGTILVIDGGRALR